MTAVADGYDLDKPFGFCTVSSRTDASSTFNITGGGVYTYPIPESFTGKVTTLKSNGQDMKGTIQNAIKNNDVVILDGADGEFIVSSNIGISGIDKTIIGINNAIISTKWYVTDEIKKALNDAGVPNMSTSGGGGKLPNGQSVSEEAEYNTRKIIIEMTKDNNEDYRKSGCISLSSCQNIIIRNITFKGPGAIDVGGYDLISCTGSKNCWVDHCEFMDGMDGNFDITNAADFNTVSWCVFRYTDRSYMHQNTNLIGSSDSETTGKLNTTFAFNWWAPGCNQRMPLGRVGKIHMLNNYYSCSGASLCMNPRKNSEFLVEGNYFASGVKNCYKNNDATAVTWANNNVIANTSASKPTSFGTTVTVPYSYTVATTNDVPDAVQNGAGATLPYGDSDSGSETEGSKGSILWAMSSNTNAEVSSALTSEITTTSVENGSNLTLRTNGTYGDIRFSLYQAQSIQTAPADDNAVTFSITTKNGYKFKASSIELYACKVGTNNGTIDVSWKDAGGTSKILNAVSPNRNNADNNYHSYYNLDIENKSTATEGDCKLIINMYNVGATDKDGNLQKKDIGLAQVMIKGTITEATGISTPVIIKGDGHIYNLRGQRVDENYKGIVIKNGKKYIQK
jgi:pectate lyase